MVIVIASEQFSLTEALKQHIDQNLERIETLVPEDAIVRVFLRKDGHRNFTALFRAHVDGRDIVTHRSGSDLYLASSSASSHLRKEILDLRRKKYFSSRRLLHESA